MCVVNLSGRHSADSLLQAVKDNKGTIEKLLIRTAERLLIVDEAMNQGIPDSVKPRMKAFAE